MQFHIKYDDNFETVKELDIQEEWNISKIEPRYLAWSKVQKLLALQAQLYTSDTKSNIPGKIFAMPCEQDDDMDEYDNPVTFKVSTGDPDITYMYEAMGIHYDQTYAPIAS